MGRFMLNRYYMQEMEGKPKDISCNAGDVSCVIDANGDVYFCELLKPIGNLKTYNWDFDRLWHDFEATQLRQKGPEWLPLHARMLSHQESDLHPVAAGLDRV